jgi:hypothetical protein
MRVFLIILSFLISFSAGANDAKNINPQNADIQKIEKYLNGITTLVAPFEQEDSSGGVASGIFYLERPGRLRWDYEPPTPILIVAKGSLVAYYDKEMDEVSHVSLDDTLAGFLTRKNISFGENGVKITDFDKSNGEISISITQEKKEEQGRLTMFFTEKNMDLVRMEVVDSIGKKTIISFQNPVYGKPIDKELFALPRTRPKKKD